eukprot:356699-Chlamydomonas_euryale.AAC.5
MYMHATHALMRPVANIPAHLLRRAPLLWVPPPDARWVPWGSPRAPLSPPKQRVLIEEPHTRGVAHTCPWGGECAHARTHSCMHASTRTRTHTVCILVHTRMHARMHATGPPGDAV